MADSLRERRNRIQKSRWRHFEGVGDLLQNDDGGVPHAALDPADVGAMQAAFERQVLLGKGLVEPEFSNICAHLPADIHAGKGIALLTFGLQTIESHFAGLVGPSKQSGVRFNEFRGM